MIYKNNKEVTQIVTYIPLKESYPEEVVNKIPDDIQLLEYIQLHGKACICTGKWVTPSMQCMFEHKVTYDLEGKTSRQSCGFSTTAGGYFAVFPSGKIGYVSEPSKEIYCSDKNIIIYNHLSDTKNRVVVNGQVAISQTAVDAYSGYYCIGCIGSSGASGQETYWYEGSCDKLKIYYFKITENNTTTMLLVPAQRGKEVGMYDVINNNFHSNGNTAEGYITTGPKQGKVIKGILNINNNQYLQATDSILDLKQYGNCEYSKGTRIYNILKDPANGGTYQPEWDNTLHPNAVKMTNTGWNNGYNSGVQEPTIGYHAYWKDIDGTLTMVFPDLNAQYGYHHRWLGIWYQLASNLAFVLAKGQTYTISFDAKAEGATNKSIFGGLYYAQFIGDTASFKDGQFDTGYLTASWKRYKFTVTCTKGFHFGSTCSLYIYGYRGSEGISYVKNVCLEIGTTKGTFTKYYGSDSFPAPSDTKYPIISTSGIGWIRQGKNLFNDADIFNGYVSKSNGYWKAYSSAYYNATNNQQIKCDGLSFKKDTQYTFSATWYEELIDTSKPFVKLYAKFVYTDGSENYIATVDDNTKIAVTSPKRVQLTSIKGKIVSRFFFTYHYSSGYVYIKDIQLEEGPAATQYEPFNGEKFQNIKYLNSIEGTSSYYNYKKDTTYYVRDIVDLKRKLYIQNTYKVKLSDCAMALGTATSYAWINSSKNVIYTTSNIATYLPSTANSSYRYAFSKPVSGHPQYANTTSINAYQAIIYTIIADSTMDNLIVNYEGQNVSFVRDSTKDVSWKYCNVTLPYYGLSSIPLVCNRLVSFTPQRDGRTYPITSIGYADGSTSSKQVGIYIKDYTTISEYNKFAESAYILYALYTPNTIQLNSLQSKEGYLQLDGELEGNKSDNTYIIKNIQENEIGS